MLIETLHSHLHRHQTLDRRQGPIWSRPRAKNFLRELSVQCSVGTSGSIRIWPMRAVNCLWSSLSVSVRHLVISGS
jgi:hypothetical protein